MKTDRNSMYGFKTTSVIIRAKNSLKKEYFCPHFQSCVLGINSLKGGKNNRKTPQIVLIYGVFLKNSLFVLFTWRREEDLNLR